MSDFDQLVDLGALPALGNDIDQVSFGDGAGSAVQAVRALRNKAGVPQHDNK
jgi:hypothetical protein